MKQLTKLFNMTDLQISAAKKTAKRLLPFVSAVVTFCTILWLNPFVASVLLAVIPPVLLVRFFYMDSLEKLEREAKRRK
jgi:ABC-type multidrug transport system fused ATPase/permease subunit